MSTGIESTSLEKITDMVCRHGQTAPAAPVLLAEGRDALTYGELVRIMDRVQKSLNVMGFGRESRIAIVGPNDPASAALIAGIWSCATAVPMNPRLSAGEFAIYLRDHKACAVAVDADMDTAAREAAKQIGLPIIEVERIDSPITGMINIRRTDYRSSSSDPERIARQGPALLDDVATVLATSGTTSHSKIVAETQRQLSVKLVRMARSVEIMPSDRCLSLMPLFHGHGLHSALGATLYSGGSLVILPEFSEEAFFHSMEALSPTWYTGSYTFHHRICAAAPSYTAAIKKSPLRFLRTASGHLETRIAEELETIFQIPVIQGYSCTELGRICANPLPPRTRKRGTVGLPVCGKVAIIGPDKEFLSPGQCGEVVVQSGEIFTGYENDPAANAQAFFDGWFRTGDEGVFDADGYLTLTGRIKDIINRGGEKITPSEVDQALLGHPDIATAVTFPVPHPTLGQEVAAAVVPVSGTRLTDETLSRYLRGKLALFKVPRRFVFVNEIPKGPTGKISRQNLAEVLGLASDPASARLDRTEDRPPKPAEAELQGLWAEALGVKEVGLNEDFFMLGGDSLQAVELFLQIEKEIGRRLPRSILFEAGTVAKMAQRIAETIPSPCLVPIQPKGSKAPFYCVHDGEGHVLNYRELARLIGEEQPFYGIQCRGLDGEDEPFIRIEDMAAFYIGEIKKIQPFGPYYVGGYSFGGRVAYVMAQQLRAAGDEVALLALIDTYCRAGQHHKAPLDRLRQRIERLQVLPFNQSMAYLWLMLKNFVAGTYKAQRIKWFHAAWKYFESCGRPIPQVLRRPVLANEIIRRDYKPQPYDGDATLFKAERSIWIHADAHDQWGILIKGQLDTRVLPEITHLEIVRQPHVQKVAAELSDVLNKAQAAQLRPDRHAV